jgi:hypothetical protein
MSKFTVPPLTLVAKSDVADQISSKVAQQSG